jgi:HlyD family type I secretion membrane fusion protein
VKEILVEDGDHTENGQVLLRLDDTEARAKLDSLTARRDSLKAMEARLIAERDGAPEPVFDKSLTTRMEETSVAAAIANQLALFRTRSRQFASEASIYRQRVAQLREQIEGARAQAKSAERQRELIEEELKGVRSLYERGYSPKTKLLALERSAEQLSGISGEKRAEIAKAEQEIGETEIQVKRLEEKRLSEITDQLRDAQTKLAEIEPQLEQARDMFRRTELVAPASGTVMGMTIFTEGGVVSPGARVLDIVPSDGALVVESRIRPEDVHDVVQGATAEIRLTGMLGRLKPSLQGSVMTVSADRLEDQRTGAPYYAAKIRIDPGSIAEASVILQPGMPADVLITTKERSVLEYLVSPLSDQIARGFRED